MKKDINAKFCQQELRPLMALLIAVVILTLGWVTYHEVKMKSDPVYAAEYNKAIHSGRRAANLQVRTLANGTTIAMGTPMQPMTVAAGGGIPPIKLSDVVTHPNYGQDCTKCHEVIGPKSRAPVEGGTIPVTANMPHPYWGPCNVCHKVVDAAGKPVAFKSLDPQSILGVELTEANADLTLKLNLPDKKGPIVAKVLPGSLAETLEMAPGDMFYKVDNRKIETIVELERALGTYTAGDTARITVWREKREKIFRFTIPDVAAQVAQGIAGPRGTFGDALNAQGQTVAATTVAGITIAQGDPNMAVDAPPPEVSVIAVASNGKDVASMVANDLGVSPYFIVVDLKQNNFKVVQNAGGTGPQVVHDLMDMGVEAVVVGHIGQGASASLTNLGIKMYPGVSGDVKGAIAAYKHGALREANAGQPQQDFIPNQGVAGNKMRRRTL